LKIGFIAETSFPAIEGGHTPVEDKVIPLFLDVPRCYYEEFHEEIMGAMPLGILHHVVKRKIKIPLDS
jgi:hypothetical protein